MSDVLVKRGNLDTFIHIETTSWEYWSYAAISHKEVSQGRREGWDRSFPAPPGDTSPY